MPERNIEKLINATLNGFDEIKRAEPKPFLFTRIMASLKNPAVVQNTWTRLGAFISKPGIATAGLLVVLIINATIFLTSKNVEESEMVQNNASVKEEFAINTLTIYDIENPEQ